MINEHAVETVEQAAKILRVTSLGEPAMDWQQLAQGFGVPSVRVENAEDLSHALQTALSEVGLRLIEMLL